MTEKHENCHDCDKVLRNLADIVWVNDADEPAPPGYDPTTQVSEVGAYDYPLCKECFAKVGNKT